MFKLLTQFKVIGDTKNITKASEIIGISQPTLTQNLSRLEKSLGVTLFVRKKHGIELTEEGEVLYQGAIETINAYNKSLEKMKNTGKNKKRLFSIGCGFNWSHTNLFGAIKNVAISYENVNFYIRNGDIIRLHEDVIANDCDMAMGSIPEILVRQEDVSYVTMFETKFIAYADKSHYLASKNKIADSDWRDYQWVMLRYNNELPRTDKLYDSLVGLENIKFNCQSVTAALKLVQDSDYLILLSENFKELAKSYGLVPLNINLPVPTLQVGIIFSKKNKLAGKIANDIVSEINKS